jgi:Cys-tRNA(Pro)/Cys-tRNA(Cys) deacylase
MTPAVSLARRLGIAHALHEYEHDPASDSYGLEAAEKLQVMPQRVFKTLVVSLDGGELAVGVLPVSALLSMKLIAKAAGARKAVMAEKPAVERSSGYVLGGVSPLGQRRKLRTFIHPSARDYPTVYVSAGRRGLEIELAPEDLRKATEGRYAEICQ